MSAVDEAFSREDRIAPPDPDVSLAGFPVKTLDTGSLVWRSHSVKNEPVWFSKSGSGRFDLPRSGTWYVADDVKTAVYERLRGDVLHHRKVTPARADEFRVTQLVMAVASRCAAVSDDDTEQYGINRALVTVYEVDEDDKYQVPQAWARMFHRRRYQGLNYGSGYTNGSPRAWALFGRKDWLAPSEADRMSGRDACAAVGIAVVEEAPMDAYHQGTLGGEEWLAANTADVSRLTSASRAEASALEPRL